MAQMDLFDKDGMKLQQTLTPEAEARFTRMLESKKWQFAKTMPYVPHWYTLRKWWSFDDEFAEVVTAMRTDGVDEMYGKRKSRVFILNGYKYWTMMYPVEETLLINRKPWPPKPKPTKDKAR